MNEKNLEEMSALMDGEVSELEVRRVLKNIEQDQTMGQTWARYQMISSVLKRETQGGARQMQALDLSARVSLALEAEPGLSGAVSSGKSRFPAGWLKPFASVAVAASVSAVVILGWQNVNNQPMAVSGSVAAAQPSTGLTVAAAGNASGSGLVPVAQSSSGFRSGAAAAPSQKIIRYNPDNDDQLNYYLISHSGNAAFNTASGVAPYARVVALKPKPAPASGQAPVAPVER